MKYATLFRSLSDADGFNINNIPWVGWEMERESNLMCNEPGKKLVVNESGIIEIQPAGPEPPTMVDLGLSVKWADANLGATNADTVESWYGDYYAWGETETKEEYSWSNYEHTNGTYSSSNKKVFIKYIPTNRTEYWNGKGDPDNKLVLESVDDAPRVQFDSPYRMPTKAECEELLDTTKVESVWINNYDPTKSEHTPADDGGISGLNGRLFTSKVEGYVGAKIFIPAAGNFNGSTHNNAGSSCFLWSSSLNSGGPNSAWYLNFNSYGSIGMSNGYRCFGLSVRCVSTD